MLYIYSRSPRELSKALARPWSRSDVLREKRRLAAIEAEVEKTAAYRAKLTRKPVESSWPKSAGQICGVINHDAVAGVARFAEALRKLQVGEELTAEEKAIPGLPDLAKYPGHPQPKFTGPVEYIAKKSWEARCVELAAELERGKASQLKLRAAELERGKASQLKLRGQISDLIGQRDRESFRAHKLLIERNARIEQVRELLAALKRAREALARSAPTDLSKDAIGRAEDMDIIEAAIAKAEGRTG